MYADRNTIGILEEERTEPAATYRDLIPWPGRKVHRFRLFPDLTVIELERRDVRLARNDSHDPCNDRSTCGDRPWSSRFPRRGGTRWRPVRCMPRGERLIEAGQALCRGLLPSTGIERIGRPCDHTRRQPPARESCTQRADRGQPTLVLHAFLPPRAVAAHASHDRRTGPSARTQETGRSVLEWIDTARQYRHPAGCHPKWNRNWKQCPSMSVGMGSTARVRLTADSRLHRGWSRPRGRAASVRSCNPILNRTSQERSRCCAH